MCRSDRGPILRDLICMLRGLDFVLNSAGHQGVRGLDSHLKQFSGNMDDGSQGLSLVAGN